MTFQNPTEVRLAGSLSHCSVEVVDHGRYGVRVHYMNHLAGEGTHGDIDFEEARAQAVLASIEKYKKAEAKRLSEEALQGEADQ